MNKANISFLTKEGQRLIERLDLETSAAPYTENYDDEYTPEIYWDLTLSGKAGALIDKHQLPLFLVIDHVGDDAYVSIDFDSERIVEAIAVEEFTQKNLDRTAKHIVAYLK